MKITFEFEKSEELNDVLDVVGEYVVGASIGEAVLNYLKTEKEKDGSHKELWTRYKKLNSKKEEEN